MTERRAVGSAVGVAAIAFLPFALGLGLGHSLYFRDLSAQFFPFRRFIAEGLLAGELRYWNPLSYEGVPLSAPPLAYPFDLLQILAPNDWGFSLLLAIHLPLAAVGFLALARALGLSVLSAAAGAVVYAVGGFALSTVNLYVYVQALAWAPFTILTLMRATEGRRQALVAAAVLAVAVSTLGAEIVIQAVWVGGLLALCRRHSWSPVPMGRLALAGVLAAGLSAPLVLFVRGIVGGTERSAGFVPEIVLAQSIHPLTLAQVVIANFHGDLNDVVDLWWGMNFFPQGFPYILSLYLGWPVLALAAVGLGKRDFPRWPLLATGAFALWLALGRWAGWEAIVPYLPNTFRYPSKAFFCVHLCAALLAAAGLDVLREGRRRTWALLAAGLLAGGALLGMATLLPRLLPQLTEWFSAGFFPAHWDWSRRLDRLGRMLADAQAGGVFALAAGGLTALTAAGRFQPRRARLLLVGLVAGDLLRAGSGLNAMVSPSFQALSPEMAAIAARLRDAEARIFTCHVAESRAYRTERSRRASHELWTFAVENEALMPFFNMNAGVSGAYGIDRTMLVPTYRVQLPEKAGCSEAPLDVVALRAAGVTHVVSLDPLADANLHLVTAVGPERIAPLRVHVYALTDALPRRAIGTAVRAASTRRQAEDLADHRVQRTGMVVVEGAATAAVGVQGRVVDARARADRIELTVWADGSTVALVREGHHDGWRAQVNGTPAPVWRANGRHLAVPVAAGTSRIVLEYDPPGVRRGLLVTLATALVMAVLWRRS